jgi:hypothetical protein
MDVEIPLKRRPRPLGYNFAVANLLGNRDRGTGNRPPPTPPGMRVRTRRFGQV